MKLDKDVAGYVPLNDLICMGGEMEFPHVRLLEDGRYGMSSDCRMGVLPLTRLREFRDKLRQIARQRGVNTAEATLVVKIARSDCQNPDKVRITGAFRRNGITVFKTRAVYWPKAGLRFE